MTFKSNTSQVTLKAYIAILHCFITGFSLVKKLYYLVRVW